MKEKNNKAFSGSLEEDPEYQLIVESNNMTVDIGYEITRIHKFIQDRYAKKFPELSNIVANPLDYARVVNRIGNEMVSYNIDYSY
jgi:U4/U6 small nuclear ribonucleoprotein PRP31